MIKQREAEIARLTSELEASKTDRSRLSKEVLEHRARIDTLTAELASLRGNDERNTALRARLQTELDELRQLLAAKASEETARSECSCRRRGGRCLGRVGFRGGRGLPDKSLGRKSRRGRRRPAGRCNCSIHII